MGGDLIGWFERWYASRLDGDWEHQYGILIQTMDNPGWSVNIDIHDTPWEFVVYVPYSRFLNTSDWMYCYVADGKLIGYGDPHKLGHLLSHFKDWILQLKLTPSEIMYICELDPTIDARLLDEPVTEMTPEFKNHLRDLCAKQYLDHTGINTKEAYEKQYVSSDIYAKLG